MSLHACLDIHTAQFVALEIVLKPKHERHKPYISNYRQQANMFTLQ